MTIDDPTRRFVSYLLATSLVVALATVLVLATDFVLLIFLGILFGVFLTKMSQRCSKIIPLSYSWNLGIVTTLLLLLLGGTLFLFGVKIESRLESLSQSIDKSTEKLDSLLAKHPMARDAIQRIPYVGQIIDLSHEANETNNEQGAKNANDKQSTEQESSSGSSDSMQIARVAQSVAGRVFKVLKSMMTTTLGLVANLGLIFFVGIFLAVSPATYRDGFAKLFPIPRRQRVKDVMDAMSENLFSWLTGQFMSMTFTGVGTGLALYFLNVPMAATLGVVTGLLTFVPNIGALLALGLAMLMALSQGPMTVLLVVIAYSTLQLIESNIFTPLVMQNRASIPPALLLSFQVIVGALTGFLGLMVATPVLAASMVLVNKVWIGDVLNDDSGE